MIRQRVEISKGLIPSLIPKAFLSSDSVAGWGVYFLFGRLFILLHRSRAQPRFLLHKYSDASTGQCVFSLDVHIPCPPPCEFRIEEAANQAAALEPTAHAEQRRRVGGPWERCGCGR